MVVASGDTDCSSLLGSTTTWLQLMPRPSLAWPLRYLHITAASFTAQHGYPPEQHTSVTSMRGEPPLLQLCLAAAGGQLEYFRLLTTSMFFFGFELYEYIHEVVDLCRGVLLLPIAVLAWAHTQNWQY